MERVFAFVDGAHIRKAAEAGRAELPDPADLAGRIMIQVKHRHMGRLSQEDYEKYAIRRTLFFDARPEDTDSDPALDNYWRQVELLPDVEMGWGSVRGVKRSRRQKRVDTLLSVAMIVGAYQKLFETALLIAGDEDYVPAVDEVRRLGVRVILGAFTSAATGVSDTLVQSVDRYVPWSVGQGWKPIEPLPWSKP
jgi:uncharacterized LabA/DUF88 family protein